MRLNWKPAAHTAWQAFAGSLAVTFGGSGIDAAHLPAVSVIDKGVTSAAVAALAAVASLIFHAVTDPKPDPGDTKPLPTLPRHAA